MSTPPTTKVEELESLMESHTRLRQFLLLYLMTWFEQEIAAAIELKLGKGAKPSAEDLIEALEALLDRKLLLERQDVIGSFLSDHPKLSDEERELVAPWKERLVGVFLVVSCQGIVIEAHNLVDDLPYRLVAFGQSQEEQPQPGDHIIGRATPLLDVWVLTGTQSVMGGADPIFVMGLAAELAREFPLAFYRNPRHLERGWEMLAEQHRLFLEFFGHPWIAGSPAEVEERYRSFLAEKRPLLDVTASEEQQAEQRAIAQKASESYRLPEQLRSAESLGLFSHPRTGLLLLPDFVALLDAFTHPDPEHAASIRTVVRTYLTSSSIPPEVLESVAAARPAEASAALALALDQPGFDWARDSPACLRRFKPEFYRHPPLPPILPLSAEMRQGLALLRALERRTGGRMRPRKARKKAKR